MVILLWSSLSSTFTTTTSIALYVVTCFTFSTNYFVANPSSTHLILYCVSQFHHLFQNVGWDLVGFVQPRTQLHLKHYLFFLCCLHFCNDLLCLLQLGEVLHCSNGACCYPNLVILLLELVDLYSQYLHGGIFLQGCHHLHDMSKQSCAINDRDIHSGYPFFDGSATLFLDLRQSGRLWLKFHLYVFHIEFKLNSFHLCLCITNVRSEFPDLGLDVCPRGCEIPTLFDMPL